MFLGHRPDLPLAPGGGVLVGLGLWNSVAWTLIVELALFGTAVVLYVLATRPRDRTGTFSLGALVVFLIAVYATSVFGPPPPDERVLSMVALSGWFFVPWGYWIDRHRQAW